ncbi:MAG: hypothetical protein A2X12_07245 [Bacteroidetes bacterium GWE2_29_8]|nr:MAG: hypothetical protein A2X12_07245 [Bacteroidetes bacterium GWE2_29_8]OFY17161.1 MAG: hypothetical protein A2X02_03445 [Bacteroidetes bacterium GWF2_29_10]
MKIIKSNKQTICTPNNVIFNFLNDFNNFKLLLPDKVINWNCSTNNCSFKIQGLADIALSIDENIEYENITYKSEKPSPFAFKLKTNIVQIDINNSEVQIVIEADLNIMMEAIITTPLTNFVNILVDKLKNYSENNLNT